MGIAQHSANDQSGGYQPLGGLSFPPRERERKHSLSELNMVKAKVILI